jgi:hypothetical protein
MEDHYFESSGRTSETRAGAEWWGGREEIAIAAALTGECGMWSKAGS